MFRSIFVPGLLMASFVTINANDAKYGGLRRLMDAEEDRELVSDDQRKTHLSTKINGNVIRPSDCCSELFLLQRTSLTLFCIIHRRLPSISF